MSYLVLYVLLGICIAFLALIGYRVYRQHVAGLRHRGSLRRSRKWFRKSHRHNRPDH